ncbi:MAG: ABC transporter substrate-binding protein [Lachnospiraceae bacterium]|nr:ABC transporter substrate-binding protein [Lachnospiraceae bacterium]
MKRYMIKRVFLAMITIAVALVINFMLIHLAPGDPTQILAGSGPFKLVEYKQGVSITLEANQDYFGQVPAYDKLVYQIIPDSNTAIQAFGNGEIDVLGVMPAGSQIATLKNMADTVVTSIPNFGRYYYGYNFKSEALADVNVRTALTTAIDRQEIVDKAFGESGVLAEGYYTPAVEWAYNEDAVIPACDKEKAEELLQEAGLEKDSDGYYLHLSMATFNLDPFLNFSQIMKANLAEIGVDLTINTLDAGAFMELGYGGEGYDMYAMGGQVGPDPSMFFHRIGTGGIMNFSNYSNEEADELFATAAASNDQEERAECYKRIQEICAEDMILVPVAEDISVYAYKDYLTGLPYDTAVDSAAQTEFTYVTFTRNPF